MARRKKNDDDQSPDNNPENNDDTFGLPEVEYEPLKREETTHTETTTETTYGSSAEQPVYEQREDTKQDYIPAYEDEDDSSPWPKILGILAILALAGGAYWFFGVYQPAQKEKAKLEQAAREEAERKAEADRLEALRLQEEQRKADSLANLATAKEGTIETLTERTRRYYVVIASAVDGDLIMDHAKKLSASGVSTKIIPPFGKAKFYRLAVAEGDNYPDTQATADGLKGEYGGAVWVVKY